MILHGLNSYNLPKMDPKIFQSVEEVSNLCESEKPFPADKWLSTPQLIERNQSKEKNRKKLQQFNEKLNQKIEKLILSEGNDSTLINGNVSQEREIFPIFPVSSVTGQGLSPSDEPNLL